jgi:hypothetical protein
MNRSKAGSSSHQSLDRRAEFLARYAAIVVYVQNLKCSSKIQRYESLFFSGNGLKTETIIGIDSASQKEAAPTIFKINRSNQVPRPYFQLQRIIAIDGGKVAPDSYLK